MAVITMPEVLAAVRQFNDAPPVPVTFTYPVLVPGAGEGAGVGVGWVVLPPPDVPRVR
jgi:hypothetical protein